MVNKQLTNSSLYWRFLPVLFFLALAVSLIPFDVQLIHALDAHKLPRTFKFTREFVEVSEFFGHGVGVIYIALTVLIMDVANRKRTWCMILLIICASLASNGVKSIIGRDRPRDVDLATATSWETWTGYFPYYQGAKESQSFPSAHTTTAMCLAVTLGVMYPQGKWLFIFMALMVGLQRVMFQAHFPSDVMGGAALGWLIASIGTSTLKVFQVEKEPVQSL